MPDEAQQMTDVEAAKLAVGLEKDGYELYTNAAKRAKDKGVRYLFEQLAHAEEKHREKFEGIEQRLLVLDEVPYWNDEEVTDYIRSIVDPGIFPDMTAPFDDIREVLLYALKVEQLSVLFYGGVAEHAIHESAREVFGEIREEEKKHVVRVMRAWRKLGSGKED